MGAGSFTSIWNEEWADRQLYFNFKQWAWDGITFRYSHIALVKVVRTRDSKPLFSTLRCACSYSMNGRGGTRASSGNLAIEPTHELCPAARRYITRHPDWTSGRFPDGIPYVLSAEAEDFLLSKPN